MECELSLETSPDRLTQSNLLKCRLAALAETLGAVNEQDGEEKQVSSAGSALQ